MSGGTAIPFIALIDGKFNLTEEAKEFLQTVCVQLAEFMLAGRMMIVFGTGGGTR
jgi:hypothetical protein